MKYFSHPNPTYHAVGVVLAICAFSLTLLGQARNNPYSPSPVRKTERQTAPPTDAIAKPIHVASFAETPKTPQVSIEGPVIIEAAFKTEPAVERLPPTEIYKIGVGDVLFVNLKNTTQGSGYYTVRHNGTIDYPLAGENVIVADRTVAEIEKALAKGISLFANPLIEVKVREYASHKITVSGRVEQPGEKHLQREAIPLFVIRAEAGVNGDATQAVITRAPLLKPETYELADATTDNVLIYPGNSVEFIADNRKADTGFYYLSGEVAAAGQKPFTRGLTLYQALIASGGAKGNPKKAVVKRKNDKGVLAGTEHNLRAIKDGKSADPEIYPGDVVEVKK